ncbi:MAG: CynX/NimT family MFS transporter [Xanthobacteraceae bacterium]
MTGRWSVLALLFAVRTAMAFQFQSVAALAPMVRQEFGVGPAEIGLLIGLYLAPGIALALPGGAIGERYGDKRVVIAGLALMICGGLIMAFAHAWHLQILARLFAGTGGVLLNVLMSKMVTDWFAGKEIATAMGIFVNSWPFGIALALVALPPVATSGGLSSAVLLTTALVIIAMIAFAGRYRAPPAVRAAASASGARPGGATLLAVIVAGLIWGLFNASIGMIFSFGPSMLAERGWSVAAASGATSVVLWLVALSVPLGGFLADRTGWDRTVLLGGFLAFAAMLVVAARADAVLPAFIVLGFVCGIPAGPIMSLPTRVLPPETRAIGMGVFYTLFYLAVVLGPWIGGYAASIIRSSRITFDLGAAMLLVCCAAFWVFRKLADHAGKLKEIREATFSAVR